MDSFSPSGATCEPLTEKTDTDTQLYIHTVSAVSRSNATLPIAASGQSLRQNFRLTEPLKYDKLCLGNLPLLSGNIGEFLECFISLFL